MTGKLPGDMKRMGLSWNDRSCVTLTDNKAVYRYITAGYAEKVNDLFESGLVDKLVEKGLLQPGKLAKTDIADFPLVIEHPFIDRISYPFEWPTLAFRDVALTILDVEEIANQYGYTIYDPHPYNAAIVNGKPVYLDYGSFVPIEGTPIWHGYEKAYRDTILFPLQLYEKKLHDIARLLLREIVGIDLDKKTRKLAGRTFQRSWLDKLVIVITNRGEITSERLHYRLIISILNRILSINRVKDILEGITYQLRPSADRTEAISGEDNTDSRTSKTMGSREKFLKKLRRKVSSIKVSEGASNWSEYYNNIIGPKPPWERDKDSWTIKELNIHRIMSNLNPATALDIGANTGWYSLMLARNGISVISLDRDEESINSLYSYVNNENSGVLPLIMDICKPSPGYELSIGTMSSASERYKSEFVMLLGIIHHMVHNQGLTLEHLANILDSFTEKHLLLELVPANDKWAYLPDFNEKNWSPEVFIDAFSSTFIFVDTWDSHPEGRKLLLFRKIGT